MLRSRRERVIQTLSYEVGGLVIATPLYMLVFGENVWGSAGLMIALSIAVLVWTPIYNSAFDRLDLHYAKRIASDRPIAWRVVHAIGLEATTVFLTVPIVMVLGGHGFVEALVVDIALTLLYTVYGFVFHLAYDRARPVKLATSKELKT